MFHDRIDRQGIARIAAVDPGRARADSAGIHRINVQIVLTLVDTLHFVRHDARRRVRRRVADDRYALVVQPHGTAVTFGAQGRVAAQTAQTQTIRRQTQMAAAAAFVTLLAQRFPVMPVCCENNSFLINNFIYFIVLNRFQQVIRENKPF